MITFVKKMRDNSLYFAFALLIALMASSCKQYTCEDFQRGEYIYADTAYKDVFISRVLLGEREFIVSGKKGDQKMIKSVGEQTEVMMRNGRKVTDIYTMIWDGPCTYSLVFKSTDSKKDQFHTIYDTIRVNVLNIDGDRFRVRAQLGNRYPEAELIKVK